MNETIGILVSAATLHRLLAAGLPCVVVDCRFDLTRPEAGENAWRAGHIPGARHAHLDRDLAGPRMPGSGRHPLPDPQRLAGLFSAWGVGPGVQVVAYDDSGGTMAARLWWLLRWLGHDSVALLDGGWQSWLEAGLPVSTAPPPPPAPAEGCFQATVACMPVADTAAIERRLGDRRLLLLDVRAPARYRGEVEPIDPVAGHIPGAINRPFAWSLDEWGRFRSPETLAAEFRQLIAGRAMRDVVVSCGSGVTACHGLFALELAGLPGACLYPGSWSEWIADPRRPVEKG